MSNKTLTATVRLNTSQAEKALSNLSKKIENIQKVLNGTKGRSGLETQVNRATIASEKARQAVVKTQVAEQKLAQEKHKTAVAAEKAASATIATQQAEEKLRASTFATQVAEEKVATQKQKTAEATAKTQLAQQRVNTEMENTALKAEKVKKATIDTEIAQQKLTAQVAKTQTIMDRLSKAKTEANSKLTQIVNKVKQWFSNQNQVNSATRSTNNILGSIWSKLKGIAATYLGIMGGKALINTADTVTSAQNKLNYVAAQQLGSSGTNADGSYSAATLKTTQTAMDKMYASSQKVSMGYSEMMSNVSKSMTLAGKSFQNSTDNAIRFQEIMAEAYTIGGASAQEMRSSMYQMIQALGAGTLAGDELRSVREGAPLAYKAIEEFAQGVYNTEESLKDLASQGKITSDMVVAAIMRSGEAMDEAFAKTYVTFAQFWTMVKNAAMKAFEPVAVMLRKMLNESIDNGLIEKIEMVFVTVSKILQITFKLIANGIQWVADNWSWLSQVIIFALILMGTYFIITKTIAIVSAIASAIAWLKAHWVLALIVAIIAVVIYFFYQLATGAITASQFIVRALLVVAAVLLLIGLIIGFTPLIVAAAVVAAVAFIYWALDLVCALIWVAITFIGNLIQSIGNFIMACIAALAAFIANAVSFILNVIISTLTVIATAIQNCINFIINLATGLYNAISAICTNIGIAFVNVWNGAKEAFWSFVADVLGGLASLEGPINGILAAFGKAPVNLSGMASAARSKAGSYSQQSYVDVGSAFSKGFNSKSYSSIGDAWSNGMKTYDYVSIGDAWSSGMSTFGTGLSDWSLEDAMNTGADFGNSIKDKVDDWGSNLLFGSSIADKINSIGDLRADDYSKKTPQSFLDRIGDALGLDFGDLANGFPKADDPAYSVADAYDYPSVDDLTDGVGKIGGDTGKIAKSMELTEEDLQFLRDLANMEWKKEYTTASITVDMTNYNSLNGDGDLDGIVTKLTDKLYEELEVFADGVYA